MVWITVGGFCTGAAVAGTTGTTAGVGTGGLPEKYARERFEKVQLKPRAQAAPAKVPRRTNQIARSRVVCSGVCAIKSSIVGGRRPMRRRPWGRGPARSWAGMRHGRRGRRGRGGRRRRLSPPRRGRVIDVDDLVYGRNRREQRMRVKGLSGVVVDLRRDLRPERRNQAWAHQRD